MSVESAVKNSFVHLHIHTEYSLVDGLVRVNPLMQQAQQRGITAVALTDVMNIFAAVKFYKAAIAHQIKPIIGCELLIFNEKKPEQPHHLIVLCQNQKGYHSLTQLISRGYIEGQYRGEAMLQHEWLTRESCEGLIALSGGLMSDVADAIQRKRLKEAEKHAKHWSSIFPNRYYLQIQRTGRQVEADCLEHTVELAHRLEIPVVATNDVRFLEASEFEAHEARVCIHDSAILQDPKRIRRYSEEQYFRSADEMSALFSDFPEAIENTIELSKRCNLKLVLDQPVLPDFPVPEGQNVESYLTEVSEKGLAEQIQLLNIPKEKIPTYQERLAIELSVINSMGFSGYFLIVADFIRWAKENGVPVGPGRGSGAGSLVAFALGITGLDPLAYDLLFERFLNPERISMPDFDIDFCMEGRDRVIEYVAEKYGRDSVSQIITFGTMAAKAAVRDVGRVLNYSYGFVDKIAKLIPFEIGMTLDKALEEPDLKKWYDEDEEVKIIIDLAKQLEGVSRNAGKHAGGVVIAPGKLTDFTAIYCEAESNQYVVQFDKDDVESIGLVKFDFLGLRTLTIIQWAVDLINQRKNIHTTLLAIEHIPTQDDKTFALLKSCQTTAVFQLESRGMKDLIKRLQPDCFEDIVALVALFRPGPLQSGMVDDFINRKHGRAQVHYAHPDLEPILKPTYGVILYQEQVMQIAQVLAGYSLGAADLLRRAMGKKKPEEMAKQRAIFIEGASKNNISEQTSTYIFDLMEKFAGYGFNKSHSAAYALIAYQTAWLKTHYPAEFMASVLSSDMDNTDKVVIFMDECKAIGLTVLSPNVNHGEIKFVPDDNGNIIYGLGAIKGVGEAALEIILSDRKTNGPFQSLLDFCCRMDSRKVTRRVIEALIKSGAIDSFGMHRAALMTILPDALKAADQQSSNEQKGQDDLFALSEPDMVSETILTDTHNIAPWNLSKQLHFEYEALGLYFSGHPFDPYRDEIRRFVSLTLNELPKHTSSTHLLSGLIVAHRTMKTKRGQLIAFVTIDDGTAKVDVAIFNELFEQHRSLLQKGQVLIIEGEVGEDKFTGGIRVGAKSIFNLQQARQQFGKYLLITVKQNEIDPSTLKKMKTILKEARGGPLGVRIVYDQNKQSATIRLDKSWNIFPTDHVLERLGILFGNKNVRIVF